MPCRACEIGLRGRVHGDSRLHSVTRLSCIAFPAASMVRDPVVARLLRIRIHRFQRRAVAARASMARNCVELRQVAHRVRRAAHRWLARLMSRHISGDEPAIRVKSRKPLAAYWNSRSACGLRAISSTSAYASRCGRWLTAAKTRSCSSGVSCVDQRAAGRQALATRSTACGRVFRQWRQHDFLADDTGRRAPRPGRSARARQSDGPARTARSCPPSAARAAATTSVLVLPASVTTVPGCRCGRIAARMAPVCATGAAISTRSAPATAVLRRASHRASMMPSSHAPGPAWQRCGRRRPHAAPRRPLFKRQRKRAANQADAEDDDLAETRAPSRLPRAGPRPSAFFSAPEKRAFSSGRPIEMRSHCGRP